MIGRRLSDGDISYPVSQSFVHLARQEVGRQCYCLATLMSCAAIQSMAVSVNKLTGAIHVDVQGIDPQLTRLIALVRSHCDLCQTVATVLRSCQKRDQFSALCSVLAQRYLFCWACLAGCPRKRRTEYLARVLLTSSILHTGGSSGLDVESFSLVDF